MFSLARVWAIARKEIRHLQRDRLTGGMIAGIPIIMTLLFGYAINMDVRNLAAAVVDEANTSASRDLIAGARATQVVSSMTVARSPAELEDMLARSEIQVGIYIPQDFERRLSLGQKPLAQILIDDSDPVVLSAARGLSVLPVLSRGAGSGRTTFEIRAQYNPERRSSNFIVPGLCGVVLSLTMVLFTAIAIVRERERGNLELLITTPISSMELMIGKIIPYIAIGYIQVTLILGIGVWLFDLPVRGSMLDFYLGVGLFVPSVLILGLIISTAAQTQFQAFQMTFMTFLPQMLLSGFMFPFEGMPKAAQYLAETFPLTHFLRIVRGIVTKEASLPALSADIWPLVVFFLLGLVIAALRFSKRLD